MPNFSWDFYILVASNDATAVRQFCAENQKQPTCLHKINQNAFLQSMFRKTKPT